MDPISKIQSSTRTSRQAQLNGREEIVQAISQANSLENPAEQISEFAKILSTPGFDAFFSKSEQGDLHWNKAIAHTQYSDDLYNEKGLAIAALLELDSAIEHVNLAGTCYDTTDDDDAVQNFLGDTQRNRDFIKKSLENSTTPPEPNSSISENPSTEQELKFYRSGRMLYKYYKVNSTAE